MWSPEKLVTPYLQGTNSRTKELPQDMFPPDQLAHLRGLLRQLGMTGRFSADKARKIKEQRDLQSELDFIQEGARILGEGTRRK
jgi:hypothetical protein